MSHHSPQEHLVPAQSSSNHSSPRLPTQDACSSPASKHASWKIKKGGTMLASDFYERAKSSVLDEVSLKPTTPSAYYRRNTPDSEDDRMIARAKTVASDFLQRAKSSVLDEVSPKPTTVYSREQAVEALGAHSSSYWPNSEDDTAGRLFSRAETESLKVALEKTGVQLERTIKQRNAAMNEVSSAREEAEMQRALVVRLRQQLLYGVVKRAELVATMNEVEGERQDLADELTLEQRACDQSQLTLSLRHWWAHDLTADLTGRSSAIACWSIQCREDIHHKYKARLHFKMRGKATVLMMQIAARQLKAALTAHLLMWRSGERERAAHEQVLQHLAQTARVPARATKAAVTDHIRQIVDEIEHTCTYSRDVIVSRKQAISTMRRVLWRCVDASVRGLVMAWHRSWKEGLRRATVHSHGMFVLLRMVLRVVGHTAAAGAMQSLASWKLGLMHTNQRLNGRRVQRLALCMMRRVICQLAFGLLPRLAQWQAASRAAAHQASLEAVVAGAAILGRVKGAKMVLLFSVRYSNRLCAMSVQRWRVALQQAAQDHQLASTVDEKNIFKLTMTKQMQMRAAAEAARSHAHGMRMLRLAVARQHRVELRIVLLQWCTGWQDAMQQVDLDQTTTQSIRTRQIKGIMLLTQALARVRKAAVALYLMCWNCRWREAQYWNITVAAKASKVQAVTAIMHSSRRIVRTQLCKLVLRWRQSRVCALKKGQMLLCVNLSLHNHLAVTACRQAVQGWMHHVVEEDLREANLLLIDEQAWAASLQETQESLQLQMEAQQQQQQQLIEQKDESQSQCIAQVVQMAVAELDQLDGVLADGHVVKGQWVAAERLWGTRVQTVLHSIDAVERRALETSILLKNTLGRSVLSLEGSELDDCTQGTDHDGSNVSIATQIGHDSDCTSIPQMSSAQKASAKAMLSFLWPTDAM